MPPPLVRGTTRVAPGARRAASWAPYLTLQWPSDPGGSRVRYCRRSPTRYSEPMAWRHALVGSVLLVAGCGLPEVPQPVVAPTEPAPTATVVPKRPEDTALA